MRWLILGGAFCLFGVAAVQETPTENPENGNCGAFAPEYREEQSRLRRREAEFERGRLTDEVVRRMSWLRETPAPAPQTVATYNGLIDKHVFETMNQARVRPAAKSGDAEFLRRVSLDLTGRIPTAKRAAEFLADNRTDKRERLVEELLGSSAWADKWAVFFGDLFKNTARTAQVIRYPEGRNAFHVYLRESLRNNKPYDKFATELITASGSNSWEQGALNHPVGGFVTGGPAQDIFDQQTANTFEQFLGVSHLNCLLCHSGKFHLDELSLWGKSFTRDQAWQLASHYSRTNMTRVRTSQTQVIYYWTVDDSRRADYTLNTTTGNRPARCANNEKPAAGKPCPATAAVRPKYLDGESPAAGENYRAFLARKITSDAQFARAAVNYIWAQFFTRGLVEPVNQFDLARLDPDNPPPAPWTLQPSHSRLLNELAAEFARNGFDLKWLMRQIANSEAYQLSSRYDGEWSAAWEPLLARKLARRLWAEELHDGIAIASNLYPTYRVAGLSDARLAMQLPEPEGLPDGPNGAVSRWLDSFFRGNREDALRRSDASISQALNLMNDNYVMSRTRANARAGLGGNEPSLVESLYQQDDQSLVDGLFLAVLSRYPTSGERITALQTVSGTSGALRRQKAEDLVWALFNKVDFVFNY